ADLAAGSNRGTLVGASRGLTVVLNGRQDPSIKENIMEFLVEFEIRVPQETPASEERTREQAEAAAAPRLGEGGSPCASLEDARHSGRKGSSGSIAPGANGRWTNCCRMTGTSVMNTVCSIASVAGTNQGITTLEHREVQMNSNLAPLLERNRAF